MGACRGEASEVSLRAAPCEQVDSLVGQRARRVREIAGVARTHLSTPAAKMPCKAWQIARGMGTVRE
eukprot:2782750-Lingulodinium_polyedra.AAC.1